MEVVYIICWVVSLGVVGYIGYDYGKKVGKWETNHPRKVKTPKDGVRVFLNNLNKN